MNLNNSKAEMHVQLAQVQHLVLQNSIEGGWGYLSHGGSLEGGPRGGAWNGGSRRLTVTATGRVMPCTCIDGTLYESLLSLQL